MLNGLFIAFVNTILLILLIIVGIFGFLATTYYCFYRCISEENCYSK